MPYTLPGYGIVRTARSGQPGQGLLGFEHQLRWAVTEGVALGADERRVAHRPVQVAVVDPLEDHRRPPRLEGDVVVDPRQVEPAAGGVALQGIGERAEAAGAGRIVAARARPVGLAPVH